MAQDARHRAKTCCRKSLHLAGRDSTASSLATSMSFHCSQLTSMLSLEMVLSTDGSALSAEESSKHSGMRHGTKKARSKHMRGACHAIQPMSKLGHLVQRSSCLSLCAALSRLRSTTSCRASALFLHMSSTSMLQQRSLLLSMMDCTGILTQQASHLHTI